MQVFRDPVSGREGCVSDITLLRFPFLSLWKPKYSLQSRSTVYTILHMSALQTSCGSSGSLGRAVAKGTTGAVVLESFAGSTEL